MVPPPAPLAMQDPGAVLDALDRAGYRELSPMAHRGPLPPPPPAPVLAAPSVAPAAPPAPAAAPPPAAGSPTPLRDRLQPLPEEERDPLVVY
jgi:hypothetical protein